jgi:hypothetical protein
MPNAYNTKPIRIIEPQVRPLCNLKERFYVIMHQTKPAGERLQISCMTVREKKKIQALASKVKPA